MRDENRKLGHDLGWIIGLGLVAVVASSLCDAGIDNDCRDTASQDPIEYVTGFYACDLADYATD